MTLTHEQSANMFIKRRNREQWVRKLFVASARATPPRPGTRPWLEVLEDRTLPSAPGSEPIVFTASPPTVPAVSAVVSFVTTTMDQATHLAVMLQQNVSNLLNGVGQEIAQELSWMEMQLDYILGINPVSPSETDTAASQSGSGSGSGAMTTANDAPQQPPSTLLPESGSGSGSGSGMASGSQARGCIDRARR